MTKLRSACVALTAALGVAAFAASAEAGQRGFGGSFGHGGGIHMGGGGGLHVGHGGHWGGGHWGGHHHRFHGFGFGFYPFAYPAYSYYDGDDCYPVWRHGRRHYVCD